MELKIMYGGVDNTDFPNFRKSLNGIMATIPYELYDFIKFLLGVSELHPSGFIIHGAEEVKSATIGSFMVFHLREFSPLGVSKNSITKIFNKMKEILKKKIPGTMLEGVEIDIVIKISLTNPSTWNHRVITFEEKLFTVEGIK